MFENKNPVEATGLDEMASEESVRNASVEMSELERRYGHVERRYGPQVLIPYAYSVLLPVWVEAFVHMSQGDGCRLLAKWSLNLD